jgi:plasmid stabilization system protein ParE
MRKLLVQPLARQDLFEIWHRIAADSISSANRVSAKLARAIRDLLDMPGKGHIRSDVKDPGYRFWSVYSFVIAYRFNEKTLTIVRVLHGHRDFRRLFRR